MGPLLPLKNIADGYELAHCISEEMLPITLNGPMVSLKKCSRWFHMGLLLPLKNIADGHEWAHCFSQEVLPIPFHGPLTLLKNIADGHEWACCR